MLILGPAIRRGAFFFRKAAGPAPRPDYNLASLLAHDHPISRTSNPVICITVPGSGRAYKQWAPAKFPPSAEALWPAACVRAPAPVTFFTITGFLENRIPPTSARAPVAATRFWRAD